MITIEYHYVTDSKELGSLNKIDLTTLELHIQSLSKSNTPICADELIKLIDNDSPIPDNRYLLSFDDSIRPSLDALEILEKHNIKAIFFLNTMHLSNPGTILPLEKQRIVQYFDSDYSVFFNRFCNVALDTIPDLPQDKFIDTEDHRNFATKTYYPEFFFYQPLERYYRILRRDYLTETQTAQIIDTMFDKYFNTQEWSDRIGITENDIRSILSRGHSIGGHTHSHPNTLGTLSPNEQQHEISTNLNILSDIAGKKIDIFSYPTNSYNDHTIEILKSQGIKCAFKADNNPVSSTDYFQIPRLDAALLKDEL